EGVKAISPRARRLAREKGVDIDKVTGTGPEGRIVEEDILNYLKTGAEAKGAKPTKMESASGGTGRRVPLTPMRKIIASRMAKSKSEAPHFYITTEIDMSKCILEREEINKGGAKVSYNDFFARAVALSMVENRTVNSVWHGDSIEERDEINIGIAVALSDGLIVPVLRNVAQKGLKEIAKDSASLIEKARNNKLTPDEYQGGTFTISNLGTFDIDNFIAIVNPGESAILAIGKIAMRPVVRDGKIEVRPICKVTLSCDHRVLDGAIAGKFLQRVKELMEAGGL
ncbi:MAG: 2-oxo acid dehydrogenase subunit E2, partial [Candidatus Omnitrophica bacterium]|nr:2-oxo acid dehydrogenase subunit E2 [Candidatus Omnitrophota bacterium]